MAQPDAILVQLRRLARPSRLPNMARFGIDTSTALGVSIPDVRRVARTHRGEHALALALWKTRIHEARILASLVDDPRQVTTSQMNAWALDFRSWDLCDQVCNNLFNRTPHAWHTARTWSMRQEEFVRRAGFVLIATLAVHDKAATDDHFTPYFELIRRGAVDERHLVKKAVSWALRQIGKRNAALHTRALATARDLNALESKAARWIARDALRELTHVSRTRRGPSRQRTTPHTSGTAASSACV